MKLITVFFLFFIPYLGFCDFADYWIVQLNDSIIYDSREDKESWKRIYIVKLSALGLTDNDTLRIVYRTDTPCPDCEYNLLLTSEAWDKKKIYKVSGAAIFDLTQKDFELFLERTQLIYFRTDEQYLKRILIIE